MKKSECQESARNHIFRKITNYTIILSIIFICTLVTKLILFPFHLPVNFDAISYFMYSSDIFLTGKLPSEWSPVNNGWPIVVSGFFMMINSDSAIQLMQIQKLLSTVISVMIIFPVYFLCKIFVSRKIALVGVILIALEPRLMINSFLGLTDPLYLLLMTTSLTLFLQKNKQLVYLSFVVVGLATLVRGEGITLFLVLSKNLGAEGIGLCRTEHMFFSPDRIIEMRKMIVFKDNSKIYDCFRIISFSNSSNKCVQN